MDMTMPSVRHYEVEVITGSHSPLCLHLGQRIGLYKRRHLLHSPPLTVRSPRACLF